MKARERARRKERLQIAAAIFLMLAVVAVAIWVYRVRADAAAQALASDTMCPASGASGHYVLLVDRTDPFTFTQKEAFLSEIADLVERRIPPGYLLSVFVLGQDYRSHAKPLVELCNPGDGKNKSAWTADVKGLRGQYRTRFLEPLQTRAQQLIGTEPADASPIFEMVQLVGINSFKRHAIDGERRLIIFSDMLHNTAQYSMYRERGSFKQFQALPYARKAQATLPGVDVELHYLMNTPALQDRANAQFWEQYFRAAHARVVSVTPLEG